MTTTFVGPLPIVVCQTILPPAAFLATNARLMSIVYFLSIDAKTSRRAPSVSVNKAKYGMKRKR
jgi:hypothetical protein